jgi:2-polyprenyl-3-methyl-5-hydroxy-6-metoxy-1,4-benzoquinol methylase
MDEGKLQAFMGKLVTDMGGAAMMASMIVGEQNGLYKAMADGKPVTVDELAKKTQCNPRLLREWLSAQAAAGYLEHKDGHFVLPPEQAMALANEDSPVYVAGGATVVAAMYIDGDKIAKAMRSDGAMAWGDHHPCLFSGTEKFFRPGYRASLVSTWLPALDGVVDKLQAGAKVADVGCGHGASTVVMAQAFPKSKFYGFDFHGPSVAAAKQRAEEGKVVEHTHFATASAKDYTERDFDLVCFFDCLHDMGDPVGAARHAYQALKPGGTVLLVEPNAHDHLDENSNPIGRMFYAASTFVCTPNALSQGGTHALGAQAGEARLRAVFTEAGFKSFRRATETPFNMIIEARK